MADGTSTPERANGAAASAAPGAPSADQVEAIDAVRRALREIEYGSVLIKIHQGEVVGIETSTKVRLKGS